MNYDNPEILLAVILLAIGLIAVVPAAGGLFLKLGYQLFAKRKIAYTHAWGAYFVAYLAASVVIGPLFMIVSGALSDSPAWLWVLSIAAALGIHLAIVPRMVGVPLRESLAPQGAAYVAMGLLLTAMVLPVVFMVRAEANRVVRGNNLHLLVNAMQQEEGNRLPAAAILDADKKPLLSWRVALLPRLEQQALYEQFKLNEPWDSPHNRKLLDQMPTIYAPVGVRGLAPHMTYYRVIVTPSSADYRGHSAFLADNTIGRSMEEISDGLSNTILIVEAGEPVPWTKPDELVFIPSQPLPKLGGLSSDKWALCAFGDGSVRRVQKEGNAAQLRAMITADANDSFEFDK